MLQQPESPYTKDRNVLLLDFDGVMTQYDIDFVKKYIGKGMHEMSRELAREQIRHSLAPQDTATEADLAVTVEEHAKDITKDALRHMAKGHIRHGWKKLFHDKPMERSQEAEPAQEPFRSDDYYERFGIGHEEMLHNIRVNMLKDPDYLKRPHSELHEQIKLAQYRGLHIVICSHSDRGTIRERLLRMELSDLFRDEDIIGLNELGKRRNEKGEEVYVKKHHGQEGYLRALDYLREQARKRGDTAPLTFDKVTTIDDSSRNLEQAHHLGIQTITVSKASVPGIPLHRFRSRHDYIDRYHKDVLEFFTAYNQEIDTGRSYSAKTTSASLAK